MKYTAVPGRHVSLFCLIVVSISRPELVSLLFTLATSLLQASFVNQNNHHEPGAQHLP